MAGANGFTREQILSTRIKTLKQHVSRRAPMVKKQNYEEKISHGVSPFLIIEKLGEMERTDFGDRVPWNLTDENHRKNHENVEFREFAECPRKTEKDKAQRTRGASQKNFIANKHHVLSQT